MARLRNLAERLRVVRTETSSSDTGQARPDGPPEAIIDWYLRVGIRRIDGWLSQDALAPLRALARDQERHGITGPAVEIGVHHGQLFVYLALLVGPSQVAVGYDLFDRQDENVDGSGLGDRAIARSNLDMVGIGDRARLIPTNSLELTAERVIADAGGTVRMFSVDGGHTPEITEHDLGVAAGSLADGGIVVLDDVFSQMWPGVGEGLRSFMDDPASVELVPFGLVGNKTLLTQPSWHGAYLAVLDALAGHFLTRRDHYYGSEVRILLDG